jgi:hypothetical protein
LIETLAYNQQASEGVGKRCRGVKTAAPPASTPPKNAVARTTVSVLIEHGTPFILVYIEGVKRRLILGTGSGVSLIQPGISKVDMGSTDMKPYGVTGETLDIKVQQSLSLVLNGREFNHTFQVCSFPTEAAGILSMDFVKGSGAIIDFECCKMSPTDIGKVPSMYKEALTGHTALTIFAKGKEGYSPQPKQMEVRQMDEQLPASPHPDAQSRTWRVKARENVTVAPRCRQVVMGILESEGNQVLPSLVCVEPAQIPTEGIFPARALTRVGLKSKPTKVTSPPEHATARSHGRCA